MRVGFGFAGHMLYELIQPADDLPSVFREVVEQRGYGFHHFGYATPAYDEAVANMHAHGYETVASLKVLTSVSPSWSPATSCRE